MEEGSPTNHNQRAGQILQKQNSLILESLSPSCDNHLFDAILNGELDNVKRCIESAALVNRVSKGTEITALHLAVACGNVTIVKLLLERGADVSRRDKEGREAVHVAAALGNLEMLGLLIDNFCDVNSVVAADTSDEAVTGELPFELFNMVDHNHNTAMKKIPKIEKGDTPLFLAANRKHKECVILLIERGAKIILDDTIGYNNSFSRNTVLARYLIDMLKDRTGSRPSTPPVVIRGGEEFKLAITCLHEAIIEEDLPLIDFLVDFDPDQLIQKKEGTFPLHRIVRKKLVKLLENVLVKRNEPQIRDIQDYLGRTALYIAVHLEWLPRVKALLKAGADVTPYPKDNRTVLHLAATFSQLEILEELLKSSKSGEIPKIEKGDTPLFLAANRKHKECVILLIERGAKIILDDTIGYNNSFSRNTVLARYLIDMLKDRTGSRPSTPPVVIRGGEEFKLAITCLHEAIIEEDLPLIDFLVDFDPDQLIQKKEGTFPLHRIVRKKLVKLLENVLVKRNEPQIRDIQDYLGRTALYIAVHLEWLPGVKALLKAGADVTPYPKDNRTVLHLAATFSQLEILEELLKSSKSGEIRDIQDFLGRTALYIAVCVKWLPGVKALLKAGADVTLYPEDDSTVSDLDDDSTVSDLDDDSTVSDPDDDSAVSDVDDDDSQLEIMEELLESYKSGEIRVSQDYLGRTPLYQAVHLEWLPGVKALLKAGADVTPYPKNNRTVLHAAANFRQLEILEELLKSSKSGEIRDIQDFLGCTALYIAVCLEWLPGVKALLKAGADVTLYPEDFPTVLHQAVFDSQLEIVKKLLKSSKSGEILDVQDCFGFTPLYIAVQQIWLPGVKALLKAGAVVTLYPEDEPTVLHLAAGNSQLEILEELLKSSKSRESRDAQDHIGRTPLYIAVQNEWLPGVVALMESGADVTLYPMNRETVLHIAATYSQLEILSVLISSDKSEEILNMLNDSQETPLCSAVRAGRLRNLQLLFYKGADTTFKLPGCRTLLHLAAEQGDPFILNFLMNSRTYFDNNILYMINYSDINGLTALHVAALNGFKSCVDLLIRHGCDVDKKTEDHCYSGSTPLHLAARKGHNEVVEKIICHKEDTLNITDANNYIPLQTAAIFNNKECIRVMLLNGADIGATVTDKFGDKMTALELIVSNVDNASEFLTEIFDQCIREDENPENELNQSTITVNYDLFRPSSYGNQLRVLESFLNCENQDVEENLLLHPVVQTCLSVKWTKFMVFFLAMIVLHMTYTVSLTVMVMSLYTTESQTTFVKNSVFICRCTMSGSLLLIILLELLQASRMQRYHFKDPESWVKWTMILLSLLVLVGYHPADWLIDVSAVAVLLSWIELLFQISRWHSFPGLYVLMFFAVAKNVVKVLATFFCVILGYIFAFMIYFRAKSQFRDWPTSFYKVMVMMNELDYESVFEDFGEKDVLVGRGIFLSFMVIVGIVLMNLLVGLAVDDIQELKKKGKAKCLAKQIGFFCMLELFVNSLCNSPYCPYIIVKRIEPWNKIDYELKIEPGKSQSYIKKSLKASLKNIILKQKRKPKEASKGED